MKKPNAIVRPVKIPEQIELAVFKNGRYCIEYDELVQAIDAGNEQPDPIDKMQIEQYYERLDRKQVPSYMYTCDIIENYFKDNNGIDLPLTKKVSLVLGRLKNYLIYLLTNVPIALVLIPQIQRKLKMVLMTKQRLMRDYDKNFITIEEEGIFYEKTKKIH